MLPVATCHPESRLSFYCDSVFADKVFDSRPSTKWLRATTRSTTWTKSRRERTKSKWRRKRSGRRWILRKVDFSNLYQPPNLQLTAHCHRHTKETKYVKLSGMSATMSLVIGIIIGSFTAMILIVIIVLKVIYCIQSSSTRNNLKCDSQEQWSNTCSFALLVELLSLFCFILH